MPTIPVRAPSTPTLPSKTDPPPATLHWVPATYPLYGAGLLVFAVVFLLLLERELPGVRRHLVQAALHAEMLERAALVCGFVVVVSTMASHVRRRRAPALPLYLRWNHALFQALLAMTALLAHRIARDPRELLLLLDDRRTQLTALLTLGACALLAFVGWLWPLPKEKPSDLRPYKEVVASLENTYDFVLGIVRDDDWKRCEEGPQRWLLLKEASLWTNLFCFGGIGSGKTSSIAYPLVIQAVGKHKQNPVLRPSVMMLDLKGDNAEKLHLFAKNAGREHELLIIRPGNALKDVSGKDVIPRSCFRTWNPIGGDQPPMTRAAFLLDGLNAVDQATQKTSNSEYFERIEREFLIAALAMFDVVYGAGQATLHHLYQFCFDPTYRASIANDRRVVGTDAKRYFEKAIEVLEDDQKTQLVSGLRAKLAPIATPVMQQTFCASAGRDEANSDGGANPTKQFEGFIDALVNRPGIVVFSVDEGEFGREIARLLGVMFMRYFHQALLKRNSSSFKAAGGNTARLVLQVTDEAAAYMNPGVAEFTAVSRQARTCSLFLTQSLAQVPERYRDVVEGNFRTKILLNVNDTLTLQRFEFLFGKVKETRTSLSTSQNLNDVRHGILTQTVSGKSQGLSVSSSTSESFEPRFSASDLLHMGGGRAVVQLYDGNEQRTTEGTAMATTPWFQEAYAVK